MNSKIKNYVDKLFANSLNEPYIRDAKEELLANLHDKYNDLVADGKSEDEAYLLVISGIGELDELFEDKAQSNRAIEDKTQGNKVEEDKAKDSGIVLIKNDGNGGNQSKNAVESIEIKDQIKDKITESERKTIIGLTFLITVVVYFMVSVVSDNWTITLALFPLGAFVAIFIIFSRTKTITLIYGLIWSAALSIYLFVNFAVETWVERAQWDVELDWRLPPHPADTGASVWSWSWLILIAAVGAHLVVRHILKDKKNKLK